MRYSTRDFRSKMSDEKKLKCTKCTLTKPESDFYSGKKHRQCKQCMRENNKNRYEKTKVPRCGFDRLTLAQKNEMVDMFLEGKLQKYIAQKLNIPLSNIQLWLKPGGKARKMLIERANSEQPPAHEDIAPEPINS